MPLLSGQAVKHLTAGVLTGIQRGLVNYQAYIANYFVAGKKASSLREMMASNEPSNKKQETHTFFGRVTAVEEDFGTATEGSAVERSMTLVNRDWRDSFAVGLYTIDDDQTGDVTKLGEQLALNFNYHRDQFTFETLVANTITGFDGVVLISASHPGAANQSNALSTALTEGNLKLAFTAMEKFTDSEGQQPAYAIPDTLWVCRDLRFTAWEIVKSAWRVSDGTIWAAAASAIDNPLVAYNLSVVTLPFGITSTTGWYITDSTKPYKPMIFQDRMKPELKVTDRSGDKAVADNVVFYVMRSRYAAGPGYWQYIVRGNT